MDRVLFSILQVFLFVPLLNGSLYCYASGKTGRVSQIQNSTSGFIENKGQIIDQHNNLNSKVLYLLNTNGMNIQLRRGGFSYDLYRYSDIDQGKSDGIQQSVHLKFPASGIPKQVQSILFHRIDIDLLNFNPEYSIETSGPSSDYLNYFTTGTPVNGVTNVRHFKTVTYKNIYPGIDIEFNIDRERVYKYNFIIHPGADVDDIRLSFKGMNSVSLMNEHLVFGTRFGNVEELIPESYYLADGSRVDADVEFKKVSDEIYNFSVNKSIPENEMLIIDPTQIRLWATYYGGTSGEYGGFPVTDKTGNVFLAGCTTSTNNIASAGSFQDTLAGNADFFLVKFDAGGERIWGSYFGGPGEEENGSQQISIDKTGNIYIAGQTNSTTGIATSGAHQTVFGGGIDDCCLAKFNSLGNRIWATYYGGAQSDDIPGVTTDKNGYVYLCGRTSSDTGISTPGSYQPNIYNNTYSDAFIAKFDSNGVRQWGTYYGGPETDGGAGCVTDTLGNVYLAGQTSSQSNIASPGAWQTTYGGDPKDAFLVKFTPGGQRIWATYYGGNNDDEAYDCDVDSTGNVCIVGLTLSTNNISSPGSFQQTYGGGDDGFLVKFDSSGQRLWGTYYGGSNADEITGCSIGWNDEIFITGWTYSTNHISTPNSYQTGLAGTHDGFLLNSLLLAKDFGGHIMEII